jgi:hypothetical protein
MFYTASARVRPIGRLCCCSGGAVDCGRCSCVRKSRCCRTRGVYRASSRHHVQRIFFRAQNPTYSPSDYGGGAGSPVVTFGGYFTGQALGTPSTCPAGAALSGCAVGVPTGGSLHIDPSSPKTFITFDGAQPNSPILSGNPTFNGPIAIEFSTLQSGVGLFGGYFDAVGSTGITAFDIMATRLVLLVPP